MKPSVCFVCLYCCLPSKKEELTTFSLIASLLCLFSQCHYLNDIDLFATAFVIAIIELSYKEYTVKKHLSPLCVRGLSVILGLKGRKLV